jgi:hypothetical protein
MLRIGAALLLGRSGQAERGRWSPVGRYASLGIDPERSEVCGRRLTILFIAGVRPCIRGHYFESNVAVKPGQLQESEPVGRGGSSIDLARYSYEIVHHLRTVCLVSTSGEGFYWAGEYVMSESSGLVRNIRNAVVRSFRALCGGVRNNRGDTGCLADVRAQ